MIRSGAPPENSRTGSSLGASSQPLVGRAKEKRIDLLTMGLKELPPAKRRAVVGHPISRAEMGAIRGVRQSVRPEEIVPVPPPTCEHWDNAARATFRDNGGKWFRGLPEY